MIILDKPDVAIIGGGPAGLAAAIRAKECGAARVLVIDREEHIGGVLNQCIHNGFGLLYFGQDLTGVECAARLRKRAAELGVEFLREVMALTLTADLRIEASSPTGFYELHAKAVVVATGCRERTRESLNIAGTRPAGIFTAGTAQRLLNIEGYIPGHEALIIGSGDIGMIMARHFVLEGIKVHGVVEILPYVSGSIRNEVQCLRDFGIPVFLSHTVSEIHGSERVEGVTIVKVDENNVPIPGSEKFVDCDAVIVSAGLIPEVEILDRLGVEIDPLTGGPVVDSQYGTSVRGLFAAGNVVHVSDLVDYVIWAGEEAGEAAAGFAVGEKAEWRTTSNLLRLIPGRNVRYAVPQLITLKNMTAGMKTRVYIRPSAPIMDVDLIIGNRVLETYKAVRPGTLLEIEIPDELVEEIKACSGPIVSVSLMEK